MVHVACVGPQVISKWGADKQCTICHCKLARQTILGIDRITAAREIQITIAIGDFPFRILFPELSHAAILIDDLDVIIAFKVFF